MMKKDGRLQIRLDPLDKELLERAAGASHLDVSAFVRMVLAARSHEVLAEREVVQLAPVAAESFDRALGSSPTVNERLLEALERPAKFMWVD